MSWDVVMFGSLAVPERNLEDWLVTPVEAEAFPFLDELGGVEVVQDTPEALLAFLAEVQVTPHEIFEVTRVDGRFTVRCFVSEDTWRETAQALGLLFGSAATFGGAGELTLYGYQGIRFGARVTVSRSEAAYAQLTQEGLAQVERLPAFLELDARIHERFDALVGRPAVPGDARRALWVVNPFTGRKVRAAAQA